MNNGAKKSLSGALHRSRIKILSRPGKSPRAEPRGFLPLGWRKIDPPGPTRPRGGQTPRRASARHGRTEELRSAVNERIVHNMLGR
jgi:hypothetical protein